MEKLQPLIVHKYWVIFSAALLLPTVGWWIDTAGLDGRIDAAVERNDSALQTVPPPNSPNASWPQEVAEINASLEEAYRQHSRYLWEVQKGERKWPKNIRSDMADIAFEGEIPLGTREIYRKEYFKELGSMHRIVDARGEENPDGKVVFDIQTFSPRVTRSDWPTEPPDSKEMWEVQQDLWLLEALLRAVAEVNRDYDNIVLAPVKQISSIELRGGNPAALLQTTAEGETTDEVEGEGVTIGAGLTRAVERSKAEARGQMEIDVDLTELFGPDTVLPTPEAEDTAAVEAEPDPFAAAFDLETEETLLRRYVDDEPGAPFKTRAFKMKVILDHNRLPDLIIELANMKWPAEIVRVQQQILNPDDLKVVQGGGGRSGGGNGNAVAQLRPNLLNPGNLGAIRRPLGGAAPVQRNETKPVEAAMKKPSVVEAVIAGKLTIFQPPPPEEEVNLTADGSGGVGPSSTTPVANGDAADTDASSDASNNEPTDEQAAESTGSASESDSSSDNADNADDAGASGEETPETDDATASGDNG